MEFIGKKINRTVFYLGKVKIDSHLIIPSMQFTNYKKESLKLMNLFSTVREPYLILNLLTDNGNWIDRSFMITHNCYFEFIKAMYDVISWFNDEKYKDLFYKDNDNKLIFNIEYKDLYREISEFRTNPKTIRFFPNIVYEGDNVFEGVHFYINDINTLCTMKYYDFLIMLKNIKDFSFQHEINVLLSTYILASLSNNINEVNSLSSSFSKVLKEDDKPSQNIFGL